MDYEHKGLRTNLEPVDRGIAKRPDLSDRGGAASLDIEQHR